MRRSTRSFAVACALWGAFATAAGAVEDAPPRSSEVLRSRADADGTESAIARYRSGLAATLEHMHGQPRLFPEESATEPRVLAPAERTELVSIWAAFSDYLIGLDAIRKVERARWMGGGRGRGEGFHRYRAAFLAQYRYALEFITLVERDPNLDTILNEPLPEIGLPAGSYDRLEFHYLNAAIALEFSGLEAIAATSSSALPPGLAGGVAADRGAIWQAGRGRGPVLTARNAGEVMSGLAFRAWFPFQTTVATAMGDIKVWRPGRSLIGDDLLRAALAEARPGDILLTRREWYLSNVGLPGYWTHAAIYVGTEEERVRAFGADAPMDPPAPFRLPQDESLPFRVIEAIGEGVVFTSFEHAADADSIVLLRPRLSTADKGAAIGRAFGYAGLPYDFNFDFRTDAALVCTELVYKAFAPGDDGTGGLRLPIVSLLGRPALPANEIAHLFTLERGSSERQLDFVVFMDGDERRGDAQRASEETFAASWHRPKWHVLAPPASP